MRKCPKCLETFGNDVSLCPNDARPLLQLEGKGPDIGRVIAGRFLLLKLLGKGGMGCVYEALQLSMDRRVAIKLLHAGLCGEQESVKRFQREARLAARLTDPHTVTLYDFGEAEDGRLFIAMELLHGRQLSDIIKESPMLLSRALEILRQICLSLEEAHRNGIIHRDLKPPNVLVARHADGAESVKVVDFGIARLLDDTATQVTQDGSTCGSPGYMAPEQVMGRPLSPASDIYSAGIMLFEMITGSHPFKGEPASAVLLRQIHDPVPCVSVYNPALGVPASLDAIIQKCVEKPPEDRYPDFAQLRSDCEKLLARIRSGKETDITADGPGARTVRKPRGAAIKGRRTLLWVTAAVLLLVAGSAGYLLLRDGAASSAAPDEPSKRQGDSPPSAVDRASPVLDGGPHAKAPESGNRRENGVPEPTASGELPPQVREPAPLSAEVRSEPKPRVRDRPGPAGAAGLPADVRFEPEANAEERSEAPSPTSLSVKAHPNVDRPSDAKPPRDEPKPASGPKVGHAKVVMGTLGGEELKAAAKLLTPSIRGCWRSTVGLKQQPTKLAFMVSSDKGLLSVRPTPKTSASLELADCVRDKVSAAGKLPRPSGGIATLLITVGP